ncbi:MAG TPA: response regulator [Pirellulaceae bacterium]|nr:response regulator [Pirellulaceae bacterium]
MSVNYSVLVVEPQAELRAVVAQHLTRRGYTVTAVDHPRQALALATFRDFRTAVVAAQLPEIDCGTLVERLRRLIGEVGAVVLAEPTEMAGLPVWVRGVDRTLSTTQLEHALSAAVLVPRNDDACELITQAN